VQTLGPTKIEVDDEIDIFLAARYGVDFKPRSPDEGLQILEHRRTWPRMNRNGRPRRLTLHELFDATEPGEDPKDHNRGRDASR